MKLIAVAAACLAALFCMGCITSGYYHTHPCASPDGAVRTVRHWHADTGYAGYHVHPFPNQVHKTLMITGSTAEKGKKGFRKDEE